MINQSLRRILMAFSKSTFLPFSFPLFLFNLKQVATNYFSYHSVLSCTYAHMQSLGWFPYLSKKLCVPARLDWLGRKKFGIEKLFKSQSQLLSRSGFEELLHPKFISRMGSKEHLEKKVTSSKIKENRGQSWLSPILG